MLRRVRSAPFRCWPREVDWKIYLRDVCIENTKSTKQAPLVNAACIVIDLVQFIP